jgi:hypothetical protein
MPLSYRTITLHPFAKAFDGPHDYRRDILLPDTQHIDKALARLQFWASADVAPLVRECYVTPWFPSNYPTRVFSAAHTSIILDTFFQLLPSFEGLTFLHCLRVDFTEAMLRRLLSLPRLRDLDIHGCSLTESSGITLPVATLCFSSLARIPQGVEHWLPVLNPLHLQKLDISPTHATNIFLRDLLASKSTFHILRSLHLQVDSTLLLNLLPILSKFPAVENLYLGSLGSSPTDGSEADSQDLPYADSSPVPLLRRYSGPVELLPQLLPGTSPSRLRIFDLFARRSFDSPRLIQILSEGMWNRDGLQWIDINVAQIDYRTLVTLGALFPNTKTILVHGTQGSEDTIQVSHGVMQLI